MKPFKSIECFLEHNKGISVKKQNARYRVEKCWGDESFRFEFSKQSEMQILNNMIFHEELFAIYHSTEQLYEFVFLPLAEDFTLNFEYVYQNNKFNLYYGKPTTAFEELMQHFRSNAVSEYNERLFALMRYDEYYNAPDPGLHPTNFFIKGDFDSLPFGEHIIFFRHVNFILSYYNRKSPTILIFDNAEVTIDEIKVPGRQDYKDFPKILRTPQYDLNLLELAETAKSSGSVRQRYIFYYQILEYCSYYYIENDLRRKVENIIQNPDILCSNTYSPKIIEIYSDYFRKMKDEMRLERLMADLCTIEDIKEELLINETYFTQDLVFDGGYVAEKIFNNNKEIESGGFTDIWSVIRKRLEKIRNVLVHARESRENVVIKPTQKNMQLLNPYLYLIRKIAEVVIIKYGGNIV